jgi:hypothetical protein
MPRRSIDHARLDDEDWVGDASFSECGRWRWWLTRIWDDSLPMAGLIGMNPSTATAKKNDHTVGKEIQFVRRWNGFGGMLKLNAFAFIATKPADMYVAMANGVDIIGSRNTTEHMLDYLSQFKVKKVVACWGHLKTDRGWLLAANLEAMGGFKLDCFKKNLDGSPAHPARLPYGLQPTPWNYTKSPSSD